MFFLLYEANPKPSHPEYGSADGSFVALWVNEVAEKAARAAAEAFLDEQGWDVVQVDEARLVTLEMYQDNPESRARFTQALQDGIVATFHEWPVGGDDEGVLPN